MRLRFQPLLTCAALASAAVPASAQSTTLIRYDDAIERSRSQSPEVAAVRARESVALAGIGVAGTYPNPTWSIGTSSRTALFSAGVSVPLVIFGQIGAARDAGRAEHLTAKVETQAAWNDVRAQVAHAFVALWLAQKVADERAAAAGIQGRLDHAVKERVTVGNAPEIDSLRTHAELLRADAESVASAQLVSAAGAGLGRWLGMVDGSGLRPDGDPRVPTSPPSLATLRVRIEDNPLVRRELADERAGLARATHERSLVLPTMALDLGVDTFDPTISPQGPNFHAQLLFDLPLFNHRGYYVDREKSAAAAAHARADSERVHAASELAAGYARFEAAHTRVATLDATVVPAIETAAQAVEDAYTLGRAPLVSVLEAEKTRIDTRLALQTARAEQDDAWIDVERIVGGTP